MQIRYRLLSLLLLYAISLNTELFAEETSTPGEPQFLLLTKDLWVEEKLAQLTLDEKIAQLMMVTVYPRQSEAAKNSMVNLIRRFKPGGILVMQGSPVKTTRWINEFQQTSDIPMLVAIDGEWGLSMRMSSTI